ncbi:MAG: glycosyltransferase [Leifsonia sp.]
MTNAVVTVLLVTHNHLQFIDRAIASIESQECPHPFQVIVADDASTDGTRERLLQWAQNSELAIHVLEEAPRLGITLNYARGFSAAAGEFVAVLEGDDEWISIDKLRLQADYLIEHPQHSMVACRVLLHDESTGSASIAPAIGFSRMSASLNARRLAEVNWFATFSACMYRADVLERLSPEVFEITSYDWMVNLSVLGFGDAGFLPQVLTLYRQHSGGEWSKTSRREREERIRRLLPRYIELSSPEVQVELTRLLHDLEARAVNITDVLDGPGNPLPSRTTLAIPRIVGPAPRVSVVMTVYNHERWIEEAISTVLDQTMTDLELIVVDDASKDGSADVVARFADPRMRVYRFDTNQGAASTLNFAIQQARSEFVAVINSDDAWELHKLQRQLDAFEAHPDIGAVFTSARFVGEDGELLAPERIPHWHDIFRQRNRSQAQWLRYFFESGNALCHPSVLIRRDFYMKHGLYDNRMRQLPDFDRWIALVKHWPIHVLGDEDLVRFRLLEAEQNASANSRSNVIRGFNEHIAVDERFFEGCSDELLIEAFGDSMVNPHFSFADERACEIALLWCNLPCAMSEPNRVHGLRCLRALLGDENTSLLMRSRYGFTELNLHAITGSETHEMSEVMRQWLSRMEQGETWVRAVMTTPSGELARHVWARMREVPVRSWPGRAMRQLKQVTGR